METCAMRRQPASGNGEKARVQESFSTQIPMSLASNISIKEAHWLLFFGYRAQRLNVANRHSFTARYYDSARFPCGEQPAHRKQCRASHLPQFFARKGDFNPTIDRPAYRFQ